MMEIHDLPTTLHQHDLYFFDPLQLAVALRGGRRKCKCTVRGLFHRKARHFIKSVVMSVSIKNCIGFAFSIQKTNVRQVCGAGRITRIATVTRCQTACIAIVTRCQTACQ